VSAVLPAIEESSDAWEIRPPVERADRVDEEELVSESFMDEIPEHEVLEAESEALSEAENADDGEREPSAGEGAGGRKPRRRRGRRGRRRRPSQGQEGASADQEGAGDPPIDDSSVVSVPPDTAAPSLASAEGFCSAEARDGEEADLVDRGDLGLDAAAAQRGSGAADDATCASSSPGSPGGGADERGRAKRASRRFPTWSEAVGIVVAANMESRRKSKSSGSPRGRKRRSGNRKR
jgi:ribonuclease E